MLNLGFEGLQATFEALMNLFTPQNSHFMITAVNTKSEFASLIKKL